MARLDLHTADPSADAAAMLRRIGFATLFFAIPLAGLFTRRALVILAPLAIVLIVLAAFLDGSTRHSRDRLIGLAASPAGIAGAVLLVWMGLSLIWTPFLPQASERVLNLAAMALVALAGYLALPERMRSANLYLLPIGVGLAALIALFLGVQDDRRAAFDEQSLERGMTVLVLLLWPAVSWLHSRGRSLGALLLALAVAVQTLFTPSGLPLYGLVAGAVVFAVTAASPPAGARLTALAMAGLLLLAPVLPFVLTPLAEALLGAASPATVSLDVWRGLILDEPLRLLTGHGLETALRGRAFGLVPAAAPFSVLFEIWYDLGAVGAVAGAVLLYRSAAAQEGHRFVLEPGIMAAFASAFTLGCLGFGTLQIWWFTALTVVVLVFVAVGRGQFRTTRPKAQLMHGG